MKKKKRTRAAFSTLARRISERLRAEGVETVPRQVQNTICESIRLLGNLSPRMLERVQKMSDEHFVQHYTNLILIERRFAEETLKHKAEDLDKLISSR
jgi:hypothetical protein